MAQIVTITNPLTGQPAQVDQLDHTAQEIDDAIDRAKAGGEIDLTKLPGIESTDYPGCYYRMVGGVVEWVNPPMQLGVEYRTTERHLGKPVYVKTLSFGALPNTTTKSIDTGINSTYALIDRSVYAINNGGYAVVDMNRFELEDKFVTGNSSWGYYITATSDFSAYTTTYVTFKYTKD